jgi:hypothetical protein
MGRDGGREQFRNRKSFLPKAKCKIKLLCPLNFQAISTRLRGV